MKYAILNCKTLNGWKTKYVAFREDWKFGKYLCRYYKGKEYTWEEISEHGAKMLIAAYKIKFLLVD